MSNEHNRDNLQSLWQSMPTTPVAITADEMRARAGKFQRTISRRNTTEYVASVFVIGMFGWYATWSEPATPLWPIANLLIIAGTLVVVWNLHRLGRAAAPPPNASAASLIDFHRDELVRQRNALRTVWLWYLAPFAPGLVLWLVALSLGTPDTQHSATWGMGITVAVGVSIAVFAGIVLINLRGAAYLQHLIDDLDRYKE